MMLYCYCIVMVFTMYHFGVTDIPASNLTAAIGW